MAYSVTDQILCHRVVHGPNTRPKRTHHVWAKIRMQDDHQSTQQFQDTQLVMLRITVQVFNERFTSYVVLRARFCSAVSCVFLCGFLYDVLSKNCVWGANFRKRLKPVDQNGPRTKFLFQERSSTAVMVVAICSAD